MLELGQVSQVTKGRNTEAIAMVLKQDTSLITFPRLWATRIPSKPLSNWATCKLGMSGIRFAQSNCLGLGSGAVGKLDEDTGGIPVS